MNQTSTMLKAQAASALVDKVEALQKSLDKMSKAQSGQAARFDAWVEHQDVQNEIAHIAHRKLIDIPILVNVGMDQHEKERAMEHFPESQKRSRKI